mmetsp:Transcript_31270/g.72759  ORF Transcript_31270/g.72759 Transcript_31270/m.72759 type:complete len:222 (-) Transcript_31270:55-720(-)
MGSYGGGVYGGGAGRSVSTRSTGVGGGGRIGAGTTGAGLGSSAMPARRKSAPSSRCGTTQNAATRLPSAQSCGCEALTCSGKRASSISLEREPSLYPNNSAVARTVNCSPEQSVCHACRLPIACVEGTSTRPTVLRRASAASNARPTPTAPAAAGMSTGASCRREGVPEAALGGVARAPAPRVAEPAAAARRAVSALTPAEMARSPARMSRLPRSTAQLSQ